MTGNSTIWDDSSSPHQPTIPDIHTRLAIIRVFALLTRHGMFLGTEGK